MKKSNILIGILLFVCVTCLAQTNSIPTPITVTDVPSAVSALIHFIFPKLSLEDYAISGFTIHLIARYIRNYRLTDVSNGKIASLISHIALNPLNNSVKSTNIQQIDISQISQLIETKINETLKNKN